MPEIGLSLKGQFKFDLYDADQNLISSSEFVDNFITNTGVLYPYYYAFADCFRYLSVGTGTGINSIINTGGNVNPQTTGLQYPLMGSGYSYVGGRTGISVSASNYMNPGCGYTETISGVNLFRQWMLPDNTGGLFTGYQTLNEFMVSPGQPYVTGVGGIKLCTCDENDGKGTHGLDCSSVAMYYNWVIGAYQGIQYRPRMCDAVMAFARVVYPINIVPNSSLNITYRLSINPNTGLNFLSLNNNVQGSSDPNWSGTLNSISKITQPGIKLINDGTIVNPPKSPNGTRLQHYNYTGLYDYEFAYEYGESFIPPMGIPLEPSSLSVGANQNIVYYLSSDNTEFLVGPSGIVTNTNNYFPWNPTGSSYLVSPTSNSNVDYISGVGIQFDVLTFTGISGWPIGWPNIIYTQLFRLDADTREMTFYGDSGYTNLLATGITPPNNSANILATGTNNLLGTVYISSFYDVPETLYTTITYTPAMIASSVIGVYESGLAPFLNNNSLIINQGNNYWSANPNTFDIRTTGSSNIFPSTGDITQPNAPIVTSYLSPVVSLPQFQPKIIPVYSGYRTGQVTYSFDFQEYQGNIKFPVRSFVAGYTDAAGPIEAGYAHGDDTSIVPFFDCLFSGTGSVFIPTIVTGYNGVSNYHNGTITGAYISGANDQNYFYLILGNGQKYPIFDTVLTWNVPCPGGTAGCN